MYMWHSPGSKFATRVFHFASNELQSKSNMMSGPPCQNETFLSNRKNTNIEISAKRKQRLKVSCGSSPAESATLIMQMLLSTRHVLSLSFPFFYSSTKSLQNDQYEVSLGSDLFTWTKSSQPLKQHVHRRKT
jgi:hypothetical protein